MMASHPSSFDFCTFESPEKIWKYTDRVKDR
jgi:hypothetical protein